MSESNFGYTISVPQDSYYRVVTSDGDRTVRARSMREVEEIVRANHHLYFRPQGGVAFDREVPGVQQLDPVSVPEQPRDHRRELEEYIYSMERNYGFPISSADRHRLLDEGSRTSVNRFFHEAAQGRARASANSYSPFEADLASAQTLRNSRRLRELERAIEHHKEYAIDAFRSASSYLREMNQRAEELRQLNGNTRSPAEVLKELEGNAFWTLEGLAGNVATFKSKEIILRHVNRTQNIDVTVNFGEMYAKWVIERGEIVIDKDSCKIFHRGHPHPHVSGEGSVCWGNAADTYVRCMRDYKINDALNLLGTLLQTYNPESPFADITGFWAQLNPEVAKSGPTRFQAIAGGQSFWVDAADLQADPQRTEEDDFEDVGTVYRCRIYQKVSEQFGLPVEHEFYLKDMNGNYFLVDTDDIVDDSFDRDVWTPDFDREDLQVEQAERAPDLRVYETSPEETLRSIRQFLDEEDALLASTRVEAPF